MENLLQGEHFLHGDILMKMDVKNTTAAAPIIRRYYDESGHKKLGIFNY